METWNNQMAKRKWTIQDIDDAINKGKSSSAQNRLNPENPAMRYEHPTTGKGVILDMKTREVIQIEGPDFQ
jgi:hypothetical protein